MFVNGTGRSCLPFPLLFLCSLTLALGAHVACPVPGQALSDSDSVVRWLRQSVLPLRTSEPGGSETDLVPLQRMIGAASIVGLGEETHGTHEFITMKARLAEFLISTMGFTTFVMENDWGRSQGVDAYINGAPTALASVMAQGLFTSWQTREYRSLLQWMRAYNASPAHATKIHFLGMDCQDLSPREFAAVEAYLQTVDLRQAAAVRRLYAPLRAAGSLSSAAFAGLQVSLRQAYRRQAQQAYALLQANRQRYIARSSPRRFALALQNARIIVQFATYTTYRTQAESLTRYYQRDTFLAANVTWIHDDGAGSHAKLLVWAHDAHVANDPFYGSPDGRNMGGELRARYAAGYVAIGTTLYRGALRRYTAAGSAVQTLPPAPRASYNATLGHCGLPIFLLSLHHLPPGPLSRWALSGAIFLNYGLGGEDISTPALLAQSFDLLVHIQQTTPARLIFSTGYPAEV
ncbi:MAG TPA: erythromycin esterase family protein [Ktedonobacteraceae bacterium]|jgi:erythromycin esterase